MLTVLASLLATVLLVAAPGDPVLTGLRQDRLWVAPTSAVVPDSPAVRAALAAATTPTYVAVLPQAQVDATREGVDGVVRGLLTGLADPRAVVVVVSDGGELQAGQGAAAGVDAGAVLDGVLARRLDEPFDGATLTSALVELVAGVDAATPPAPPAAGAQPAGSTRRTVGLVGLVATLGLGGGGLLYARSQRRARAGAPPDPGEPSPRWG